MARLNASNRERIVKELLRPVVEEFEKKKKELEEKIDEFCYDDLPIAVRSLLEVYPNIFKRQEYISLNRFIKDPGYQSLELKYYFSQFSSEEKMKQDVGIMTKTKEVENALKKRTQLKGVLTCTLDKFNTEKQLENNFPEAYKALKKIVYNQEIETNPSNLCDSVENLRAQLLTYQKKSQ